MFMSLGRMLFRKKILLNIIVIIQLGLALIISNILIGNYNKTYRAYNFTQNYSDSVAFFSPMRIGTTTDIAIDYDLLADENTSIEFFAKITETDSMHIFCYGSKTCEGLSAQLKAGEWTPGRNGDGYINCMVIGNKYKIGDTFSQTIGGKSYSFCVSSITDSCAMVISPSRSSSVMRSNMLFYEYDSDKNGCGIICSCEELADAVGTYGNALIFNTTEKSKEHLQTTGTVISMPQICSNSNEELSLTVKSYMPLAVCFGLMGFVSAVGMACMNLLCNKNVFDIYFICGMKKKDGFLLNLGYMCWIIFGVIIVTLALFILCNMTGIIDNESYLAGIDNYVFSALYLTAIPIAASVLSLFILKPTDISKN